jgi:hypothetical protein
LWASTEPVTNEESIGDHRSRSLVKNPIGVDIGRNSSLDR